MWEWLSFPVSKHVLGSCPFSMSSLWLPNPLGWASLQRGHFQLAVMGHCLGRKRMSEPHLWGPWKTPPSEVWDWEPCSGWNHRAIYSQKLSALQISTVRKSGKHNQGSWENQAVDKAVNCSILCTQVLRALSKSALKHCLTWTAVKAISPMLSRIVLSNDNKRVGTLEITS